MLYFFTLFFVGSICYPNFYYRAFISNLLVIFFTVFSLFYFSKVIVVDVFKTTLVDFLLVSIPIISTFIQFIPSAAQGLYWMDGSLELLSTSFLLIIITLIIKEYLSDKTSQKVIYSVLAIILAIVSSGFTPFNFVTFFILLVYSLIYCVSRKIKINKLQFLIFLILLIGLIIALIAPGNAIRQAEGESTGFSIPKSILYALLYSVFAFGQWMNVFFLVALIFASIIFYSIAKNSRFMFKYPLLVFLICYSVYASRFSVYFYSLGGSGSPRQQNIYYYGFIVLMSISWLYFVGWLSKRNAIFDKGKNNNRISLITVLLIAFIMIASLSSRGISSGATSVSTAVSLIQGKTQTYHSEMIERIKLYENDSISDVVVTPLTYYPSFFVEESLTEDKEYWTNNSVALYFQKDSVVLDKGK